MFFSNVVTFKSLVLTCFLGGSITLTLIYYLGKKGAGGLSERSRIIGWFYKKANYFGESLTNKFGCRWGIVILCLTPFPGARKAAAYFSRSMDLKHALLIVLAGNGLFYSLIYLLGKLIKTFLSS